MEKSNKCTVYIDESGDLGVNRGTKWFVLSAVIVNKEDEPSIRNRIANIKAKLNIHELHFCKIREFYKKAYAVKQLNEENFTYINIIVDTQKLKIKTYAYVYNYACRLLLERVSWILRDTKKIADIMLSARGTNRDQELIDYIKTKLIPNEDNEVYRKFEKITSKSANEWDLLQLADVCATTTYMRHEINSHYGFCVPCFAIALSPHLYQHNHEVLKYGIKYFSDDMIPDKIQLDTKRICSKTI